MESPISIIQNFLSYSGQYNITQSDEKNLDIIILCGNDSLKTVDIVVKLREKYRTNKKYPVILISGGIGRCTPLLYKAIKEKYDDEYIKKNLLIKFNDGENMKKVFESSEIFNVYENGFQNKDEKIQLSSLTEAEIFSHILHTDYDIPYNMIFVDIKSTNTGENAYYTVPFILKYYQIIAHNQKIYISIVQNHLMLRRTMLSFSKILNELVSSQDRDNIILLPISFTEMGGDKIYIQTIKDEYKKVKNDKDGYGPNGKNFIDDVGIIPDEVEKAYRDICLWEI